MPRSTTSCKYCGAQTFMLRTKLCDGCWEISHRVSSTPLDLLANIVAGEMATKKELATFIDHLEKEMATCW